MPQLGATPLDASRCAFRVWAPLADRVEVRILNASGRADDGDRFVPLAKEARGYHSGSCDEAPPGTLYLYRLDGQLERPDPASRHQPQGVHGPSAVVEPAFAWSDDTWAGLRRSELVFYELHVGTFTPEGTFDAIVPRLDALRELGVTAIELMPVAQFPGDRNWGYDGVYPFAAHASYGGVAGFRRLVDACHAREMAIALDVVYNHLGPEGNYLDCFGPYFTDRYHTPWGRAVNFDDAHSDEVRAFFIESALYWLREMHVDVLRIDAIHGIFDFSAHHILAELQEHVQAYAQRAGRRIQLIAESDLNDACVIRPRDAGGHALDAQWSDDFHHSVHTLLTSERSGYYDDFGELHHLVRAINEGFTYSGQYSKYRRRKHGNSAADLEPRRFVVCTQNHDQVGNRVHGDRLATMLDFEAQKVCAALLLLAPQIPLLFMGQEYGETTPFRYFVSHEDPDLVDAVRRGRKAEFAAFAWQGEPPDPDAEATFFSSRIDWSLREREPHRTLLDLHRELLQLRSSQARMREENRHAATASDAKTLLLRRWSSTGEIAALFHLRATTRSLQPTLTSGEWTLLLDTAATRWRGPGSRVPARLDWTAESSLELSPWSCIVLARV
jgi:maltooligosyltrehalose trehalohydrolase